MDARFTITVLNRYQSPAECLAALAAVDITPVVQRHANDFVICADTTTNPSEGTYVRTITAALTATFEAAFPTETNKVSALRGAFKSRFELLLPSQIESNIVEIGAFCP